jgi:methylenetetrahydrofolate--tRNA-(uracil-5-)-methyltransferase
LENASGLLKEEMRLLDSIIVKTADSVKVPAGGALAVDREKFSQKITDEILENKNIEVISEEVTAINKEEITVIATGPLTSDLLAKSISEFLGNEYLYFFDAAAPVVYFDSIDMTKAFKADRYGKRENDYINCPMNKEEYEEFYNADHSKCPYFVDKDR